MKIQNDDPRSSTTNTTSIPAATAAEKNKLQEEDAMHMPYRKVEILEYALEIQKVGT
jgi:hypothetical protein